MSKWTLKPTWRFDVGGVSVVGECGLCGAKTLCPRCSVRVFGLICEFPDGVLEWVAP